MKNSLDFTIKELVLLKVLLRNSMVGRTQRSTDVKDRQEYNLRYQILLKIEKILAKRRKLTKKQGNWLKCLLKRPKNLHLTNN